MQRKSQDLSTLPTGTTGTAVQKAMLKLWVNTVTTAGTFDVFPVTSGWNEESITAATAPTLDPVEVSGVSVTTAQLRSFVTVDPTNLVKDWQDNIRPNHGIALQANAGTSVRFDSKENTGTSHEARLEIVLQPADISARVYHTGPVTIPDSVNTVLTFDSARYDTANIHNPDTNASRLTAPIAGKYLLFGHVTWVGDPTIGLRQLAIYKNGDPIAIQFQPGATFSIATHHELKANDYVELLVFQNSGGPHTIADGCHPAQNYAQEFGMVKVP
jgi:hypothetical protein